MTGLSYILLLIYLLLCCWLLTKSRFIKGAGISTKIIIGLFLLKVLAGLFNGWLSFNVMPEYTDTESFHAESLKEYQLLFSDPKEYFTNIFRSGYPNGYAGFFASTNSYWNDLKGNLLIKLLSIFNIFSFGSYYINVVFFNFLIFFGHVALFKIFKSIYKDKATLCIISCFLLPSLLYFTSCIHKDGLIFTAICLTLYGVYSSLKCGLTFYKFAVIIISCIFILLQRNYVMIALLPALVTWILVELKKYNPLITFSISYLIGLVVFFSIGKIHSSLDLPQKIIQRQKDFFALPKANSTIPLDTLKPGIKSFINTIPQAIDHSVLRPYLFQKNNSAFLVALGLEIAIYLMLFFILIFFHKQDLFTNINSFTLFSIAFGISIFLIIGYTIPIVGAIVRYRSIYLPFIITPIICNIDIYRLLSLIRIKK